MKLIRNAYNNIILRIIRFKTNKMIKNRTFEFNDHIEIKATNNTTMEIIDIEVAK